MLQCVETLRSRSPIRVASTPRMEKNLGKPSSRTQEHRAEFSDICAAEFGPACAARAPPEPDHTTGHRRDATAQGGGMNARRLRSTGTGIGDALVAHRLMCPVFRELDSVSTRRPDDPRDPTPSQGGAERRHLTGERRRPEDSQPSHDLTKQTETSRTKRFPMLDLLPQSLDRTRRSTHD